MLVLGIETSCDETAACLLEISTISDAKILSEEVSSQVELHALYGGVVPELASREHLSNLPILVDKVLKDSKKNYSDLNLIAVTRGPGLKGCLLIGLGFAQGLSFAHQIPLVGVNHIEGHVLSGMLDNSELEFPYLCLVVSGGHTEILAVKGVGQYQVLTRTTDDAAGEAFDKSANLLGFEYPGGAKLAALADTQTGSKFVLPKVMREAEGFSFSGLKTAISLLVKKTDLSDPAARASLAFAVQASIVDALMFKLKEAIAESGYGSLLVCGGVSANQALRKEVSKITKVKSYFPKMTHCIDNAAMIAFAGALHALQGERLEPGAEALARWPLESLSQ